MIALTRRSVIHAVGVLLLVAIVVPFVIQAVPAVVGADHSFVVLSGSMEPAISPGDVVIVRDVPADSIRVGDVITFSTSGSDTPTTHRVVDVRETASGLEFKTKGDANENVDNGWRSSGAVLGRLLVVIPFIGHVTNFVSTPLGFVTLVAAPFALLVGSELFAIVRAAQSEGSPADGSEPFDDTPLTPATEAPSEADASDATAESGDESSASDRPASSETDDAATLSVTHTDLRLTVPVLVAFATYSIWIAVARVDSVSAAIAAATTGTALVAIALFFATRPRPAKKRSEDAVAADGGAEDAE